jgi:hypothetical protein
MSDTAGDLIRARTAAEASLRVAIDAGRSMGYRDGLTAGRKAGATSALLTLAADYDEEYGDNPTSAALRQRAVRIESGEVEA